MHSVLWVGLGGFAGAILRYVIAGWVQRCTESIGFPYGTLAVNMIGCLVIGLLTQLADARNVFGPESRMFVFVGLLGAFTTFSTLENETLGLLREGHSLSALANMAVHVVLGLGMVWLGRTLAATIWR